MCLYVVCVICLYVRTRARVCVCVLIKSVCASLRVFANMYKITCVRKRDKQTEKKREEGRGGVRGSAGWRPLFVIIIGN